MVKAGYRRLLVRPVRRYLLLLFVPWTVLILLLMALLYERLLDARLDPLLRDQQVSLNEGVGCSNVIRPCCAAMCSF